MKEVLLAGAEHKDAYSDLKWSRMHPRGNWAIRTTGFTMRKAFRRGCHSITFDQDSFEQATAQLPPGSLVVLAPTHRSMMDFIVCSYLCFDHPELNISIPYIAADLQIGGLPFLGWFLKQTHAFYLKRGRGGPDPELNRQIRQLVSDQQTLEIFIEGTRSRSRQCMKPKRGLLRALQNTGVPVALLPICITYDRLPEETALMKEMQGGAKPLLSMKALLKWTGELIRGQVNIGRVHMACGEPVTLNQDSDVHQVSYDIMHQLQARYVVSTYHLKAFLKHVRLPIDLETLSQMIVARGGTVIESPLEVDHVDLLTTRTFNYQWIHLFYSEALTYYGPHPALVAHVNHNSFGPRAENIPQQEEAALKPLLEALFLPLFNTYERLRLIAREQKEIPYVKPRQVVAAHPDCFLPVVEEAFTHLVEADILARSETGFDVLQPKTLATYAFPEQCQKASLRK